MVDDTETADYEFSCRLLANLRDHSSGSWETLKSVGRFEDGLNLRIGVDFGIMGDIGVDTVQIRNGRLGPDDPCHRLNLRLTSSCGMTRPSSAACMPRAIFIRT